MRRMFFAAVLLLACSSFVSAAPIVTITPTARTGSIQSWSLSVSEGSVNFLELFVFPHTVSEPPKAILSVTGLPTGWDADRMNSAYWRLSGDSIAELAFITWFSDSYAVDFKILSYSGGFQEGNQIGDFQMYWNTLFRQWRPFYADHPLDRSDDSPAPVPEPSTIVLLGTGLVALARHRRR